MQTIRRRVGVTLFALPRNAASRFTRIARAKYTLSSSFPWCLPSAAGRRRERRSLGVRIQYSYVPRCAVRCTGCTTHANANPNPRTNEKIATGNSTNLIRALNWRIDWRTIRLRRGWSRERTVTVGYCNRKQIIHQIKNAETKGKKIKVNFFLYHNLILSIM